MLVKYSTAYGDVGFALDKKQIIIAISGGFDSAVTLYGLAKAIHEHGTGNEIHPITVRKISNDKNGRKESDKFDPFPAVQDLVNWIQLQFTDVIIHAPTFGDVFEWWTDEYKYTAKQYELCEKIAKEYNSNDVILYSGMTMNPPIIIGKETSVDENGVLFKHNAEPKRDKITEEVVTGTMSAITETIIFGVAEFMPFANFDKRAVFSFADTYYGDVDTFLNMTRSCEGRRKKTNNFTTPCDPALLDHDEHICWWCYEREWAAEQYEKDKENGFKL